MFIICVVFTTLFTNLSQILNKRRQKTKQQSGMDNQETLATLATQDTEQRQITKTQQRKLRRQATQTPPKIW